MLFLGGVTDAHFEEGEVHLFGVCVLLFVHTSVQVLHVQHNAQQSVHLVLRNVLQVSHMVT